MGDTIKAFSVYQSRSHRLCCSASFLHCNRKAGKAPEEIQLSLPTWDQRIGVWMWWKSSWLGSGGGLVEGGRTVGMSERRGGRVQKGSERQRALPPCAYFRTCGSATVAVHEITMRCGRLRVWAVPARCQCRCHINRHVYPSSTVLVHLLSNFAFSIKGSCVLSSHLPPFFPLERFV